MTQTVVIGLDGANWGLIDQWIEEGDLPNIRAIRDEGTHSTSRSELPPVTCPNWKCYSTSKNPGELGVFWWEHIDMQNRTVSFPDANSFNTAEIWDYLGDAGLSWAAINMPTTYPPREIPNGEIIAGGPLCADTGYTSDPELEAKLESRFNYRVRPRQPLTDATDSGDEVSEIISLIDTRFDVAEWYLNNKQYEFVHLTLFLLNLLQHYFWRGTPTKRAWELIDERIGDLLQSDRNIVLMSDHGCSEIDTVFHINQWLQEEGYLQTTRSVSDALQTVGITKERVKKTVDYIGLGTIARQLPSSLKNTLPQRGEGTKREGKIRRVEWDSTSALASGQGPVYTNNETAIPKIIADLKEVKTPSGKPIASAVYHRDDVYSGRYQEQAPQIIIDQTPGIHIADGVGTHDVFTAPSRWSADNDRNGLFAACGPQVASQDLGQTSILDIAPTLLSLMKLKIPTDFEGQVLNLSGSMSEDRPNEVDTREPITDVHRGDGPSGSAEERLRDLGYLSQ